MSCGKALGFSVSIYTLPSWFFHHDKAIGRFYLVLPKVSITT